MNQRFLYTGHGIERGDKVKAIDASWQLVGFYRVEYVWENHVTMCLITMEEAGPNPVVISVQPEAKLR